jgi:acid phosphatase
MRDQKSSFVQTRLVVVASMALTLLLSIGIAFIPAFPRPVLASAQRHVLVIVEENQSYDAIIGNPDLPYINSLANQYGVAANHWGLAHPSQANYLGLVSGSVWDKPQDLTPQQETYAGPTLADQLVEAGYTWKAYMEDMPVACDLTDTYSPAYYDVNHNPFMYFDSIRSNAAQCNRDVPFTEFATDLQNDTAPAFMFVSPNLLHDMHDGTYQQADDWLRDQMQLVLASRWYAEGGIVIITWDEGETNDQIPTIVVSSSTSPGTRLTTYSNHYATLRAIEERYGLGYLGGAADAANGDITPLFGSYMSPTPTVSPSPTPSVTSGGANPVRGIFRFGTTAWTTLFADGFNTVTDGGANAYGRAQQSAGLNGVVWMPAYDNTTCAQTMTDAAITTLVSSNTQAGLSGLTYQVGDEPTTNGCNAAPTYAHITQLVHAADSAAKTWVADDQFNDPNVAAWPAGIPMAGSVDIIAFDVYPCLNYKTDCDFAMIDGAVQRIHSVGLQDWEFILQDFGPCESWRAPTSDELLTQFQHWQNGGAIGYFVYGYDADPSLCPGNVTGDATLQQLNGLAVNPASAVSPSPSPSPTASPTPSPTPSPSPSPVVSPLPSPSPSSGLVTRANLVANPGFENNLRGWNTAGNKSVSLVRTSGFAHSGAYSALLGYSGPAAGRCLLNDSPNWIKSTSSGTYTASLWVRSDGPGAQLVLSLREWSGSGALLGGVSSSVVLSGDWQNVEVSYQAVTPGSSTLDFQAYVDTAAPGPCFYADDSSIVLYP